MVGFLSSGIKIDDTDLNDYDNGALVNLDRVTSLLRLNFELVIVGAVTAIP